VAVFPFAKSLAIVSSISTFLPPLAALSPFVTKISLIVGVAVTLESFTSKVIFPFLVFPTCFADLILIVGFENLSTEKSLILQAFDVSQFLYIPSAPL